MIIRIVKMAFREDAAQDFLNLFETVRPQIRSMAGCRELRLLREKSEGNVFFTWSLWDSEAYLEQYRNSALFRNTWSQTKALFAERAAAWTVEEVNLD